MDACDRMQGQVDRSTGSGEGGKQVGMRVYVRGHVSTPIGMTVSRDSNRDIGTGVSR